MSPVTSLTLLFPAYDEAANVGPCLDATRAVLVELGLEDFEILFVDDGSTDGTSAAIHAHAAGDPRVRVVRHATNQGYGAAVRTGIASARGEWLFMSDADLQFRMADLARLVPLAEDHTFVQGYRQNRADRASRVLLGRVYRALVHAFARVPVRDPECSFRLVRTSLLDDLGLVSRGPLVPVELVVRAHRRGAVFGEIAVPHFPRTRGESKALTPRSLAAMAVDVALVMRDAIGRSSH